MSVDSPTRSSADAIALIDRVNRALGYTALSTDALHAETADIYGLQQLARAYAEYVFDKNDWINLSHYIAQLAVVEGAISAWQWTAPDLTSFALSDYLTDRPAAGDALRHEITSLLRRNHDGRVHDQYRNTGFDTLRAAREIFDRDGTTDEVCATVVTTRVASDPDTTKIN